MACNRLRRKDLLTWFVDGAPTGNAQFSMHRFENVSFIHTNKFSPNKVPSYRLFSTPAASAIFSLTLFFTGSPTPS